MQPSTTLALAMASYAFGMPAYAQVAPSLDGLSHPRVTLRCLIVDDELRTGRLELELFGGRAFLEPGAEQANRASVRLTKPSIEVIKDELDLLPGAVIRDGRLSGGMGTVHVRLLGNREVNLSIGALGEYDRSSPRKGITIVEPRDGDFLIGPYRGRGICDFKTKEQAPLTAEEVEKLAATDPSFIRDSAKALPGPAAAAVSRKTAPDRKKDTAQTVTQPLQTARCVLFSDDLERGELEFTLSGGRGYAVSVPYTSRTDIEKTRRVMTINSDGLEVFSDKYPIRELQNSLGPHPLYSDLNGVRWALHFGSYSNPVNKENLDIVETVAFTLEPDRRQDDDKLRFEGPHVYLGLCKFESIAQEPLDQTEIREALWQ